MPGSGAGVEKLLFIVRLEKKVMKNLRQIAVLFSEDESSPEKLPPS